jgi:hypothetical protein
MEKYNLRNAEKCEYHYNQLSGTTFKCWKICETDLGSCPGVGFRIGGVEYPRSDRFSQSISAFRCLHCEEMYNLFVLS